MGQNSISDARRGGRATRAGVVRVAKVRKESPGTIRLHTPRSPRRGAPSESGRRNGGATRRVQGRALRSANPRMKVRNRRSSVAGERPIGCGESTREAVGSDGGCHYVCRHARSRRSGTQLRVRLERTDRVDLIVSNLNKDAVS